MGGKDLIEVKNLSKRYGKITAIKNLNFTVEKGEILGFLGPNGAGKSTTMKIITGFIPPSSGTVIVNGFDVQQNDFEVKKSIGYLPENPPLYNDMTVISYLKFVAELKGIPKKSIMPRVKEVIDMLNLGDVSKRLIKNLSKGYKQRVGLAQAILGNPKVLVLDEPTIGLDPNQIIEIRDLIKKLSHDRTIILSTHILPEVSQLCQRVVIINKGEIVATDTTENLANSVKENNVLDLRIIGIPEVIMNSIKSIRNVSKVEFLGEKEPGAFDYRVYSEVNVDIRHDLFENLTKNDCKIIELKTVNVSLEEIFLQLTTNEEKEEIKDTEVAETAKEENEDEQNDGNM